VTILELLFLWFVGLAVLAWAVGAWAKKREARAKSTRGNRPR
jgi:hypothetical protein